jgi:hypothetical protein
MTRGCGSSNFSIQCHLCGSSFDARHTSLQSHLSSPWCMQDCEICGARVVYHQMATHKATVCKVPCPHCNEIMLRNVLDAHVESACPILIEYARITPLLDTQPLDTKQESLQVMREKLATLKSPLEWNHVTHLSWVCIGLAGVGKSTLWNSLATCLASDTHVRNVFSERGGFEHGTATFNWRDLDKASQQTPFQLRLMDLWGHTAHNFKQLEAALIVEGKMPRNFKDGGSAMMSSPGMLEGSLVSAPHGILYVVDAHSYDSDAAHTLFTQFTHMARVYSLPIVAVVTKIDEYDEEMLYAPHKAYQSRKLFTLREHVAKQLSVPIDDVYLVKGYKHEQVAHKNLDAPLLRLSNALMSKAHAYLQNVSDGTIQVHAGVSHAPMCRVQAASSN